MDAPINRLKIALGGTRCTQGMWLGLASSAVAELAAHSGLDWLMIDAEHGPNTPPHGIRGIGSSIARASLWGTRENYMDTAQDQICVIVQAESRAAVENIDAIAATDGVDCVFIGPADLAADMGHTGNPTHPEVEEAILHLTERTVACGKAPGFFRSTEEMGRKFVAAGGKMMAIGTDSRLLASGIQSVLTA